MNTCNPYESITNITQQLSARLSPSLSLSLFATLGLAVCRYHGKLWTPWKSNERYVLSDLLPSTYLDVRVFATEAFIFLEQYIWLQLFSSFQMPSSTPFEQMQYFELQTNMKKRQEWAASNPRCPSFFPPLSLSLSLDTSGALFIVACLTRGDYLAVAHLGESCARSPCPTYNIL